MNTTDRNKKIKQMLEEAALTREKVEKLDDELIDITNEIFNSDVFGYREVIIVVVVAMLIDPKYKASKAFYDCNPRALYEGPIRDFFIYHAVPHRKSGPLNIAKATSRLDKSWAAQRRPLHIAEKVVEIISRIEKLTEKELNSYLQLLVSSFLQRASEVKEMLVEAPEIRNPFWLAKSFNRLISEVPDRGNTPQRVCGYLLESIHKSKPEVIVLGADDSSSTTNTTSKKPGDILVVESNEITHIIEITVKKFDSNRLHESTQSVFDYIDLGDLKLSTNIITVISRPEDFHSEADILSDKSMGILEYNQLKYIFIPINNWVNSVFASLTQTEIDNFVSRWSQYVNNPNTDKKVKILWKELVEEIK